MVIAAVELAGPPLFAIGDKVRCRCLIRNDGTFCGRRTGETLVTAGEVGYVHGVGEFLQRYYIYDVDFYERGVIIGMRGHELECLEPSPEEDDDEGDAAQDR